MNEVLAQLVAFLKEASPLVWSTLIKQVYVEASANIVWSISLFVVCILLAKFGNYGRKQYSKQYIEDKYNEFPYWEEVYWLAYICSGISGAIAFAIFVSALKYFANPGFYAIRFIISSIGG